MTWRYTKTWTVFLWNISTKLLYKRVAWFLSAFSWSCFITDMLEAQECIGVDVASSMHFFFTEEIYTQLCHPPIALTLFLQGFRSIGYHIEIDLILKHNPIVCEIVCATFCELQQKTATKTIIWLDCNSFNKCSCFTRQLSVILLLFPADQSNPQPTTDDVLILYSLLLQSLTSLMSVVMVGNLSSKPCKVRHSKH